MTKRTRRRRKPALETVAPAALSPKQAGLRVRVFSGRRLPLDNGVEYTLNVTDGAQRQAHSKRHKAQIVEMTLPFHDNFADNYAISVGAKGFLTCGQAPVRLRGGHWTDLSLMLVPKDPDINFHDSRWELLSQDAFFGRLLANTTEKAHTGRMEDPNWQPPLACLFNLLTALRQVQLVHGTCADLVTELSWKEKDLLQDRSYAWVHRDMEEQVRQACEAGIFEPDAAGGILHPGATSSYRQKQFEGTNLQISFHADDRHPSNHDWIKAEFDIDYFRDPLAHLLLEVFVNHATGGRTDPRRVYVMRWAAGLKAGLPNFNPPYHLI